MDHNQNVAGKTVVNRDVCCCCGASSFAEKNGKTVCQYCGAPKPRHIPDELLQHIINANQQLLMTNFQEAAKMFSQIILQHKDNAQAYWGRLSARYNIKFETVSGGKLLPTCYADHIESITKAEDYKSAWRYADEEHRAFYERQAAYIEEVRTKWLELKERLDPYDIFISYKESDLEQGVERTQDSEDMEKLYRHLTKKGYRVFFSRESLKEATGKQYEPYIFHALSTAEVMILYGTKPEYMESAWIRNEWSRYLKYIENSLKPYGSLLTVYKGFSAVNLPMELSKLQAFRADGEAFYEALDGTIARLIDPNPSCDHDVEIIPRREPTCTDEGATEGKRCKKCGCTLKKILPIKAKGHQFGDWYVSVKAGCLTNGEYTRRCLACGEKQTKLIPMAGRHSPSDQWEIAEKPGPGKNGLKVIKCSVCGEILQRAVIPALHAASLFPATGLAYRINPDGMTCTVTGKGTCSFSGFYIPSEIDGYRVTGVDAAGVDRFLQRLTTGFGGVIRIELPDSVTSIGESAFHDCASLQSILIPGSVKKIGANAFCGCTGLQSVVIPDSVTSLGDGVCKSCAGLIDVNVGNGVPSIGFEAFADCANLASLSIGNAVAHIYDKAFSNCTRLMNVTLPFSVEAIHGNAFSGCKILETVTIPDSVRIIEREAFRDCAKLRRLELPKSIRKVENAAFLNCTSLETVTLPDGVEDIGEEAFSGCESLRDFKLPVGLKKIRGEAFFGCRSFCEVTIPDAVEWIGEKAFSCCTNLVSVTLSNAVKTIGNEAFSGCRSLTGVHLPQALESIGAFAFFDCDKLETLKFAGSKRKWKKIWLGDEWKGGSSSIHAVECIKGTVKIK